MKPNLSPIAPLKESTFRMLWLTWLTANLCMWMNDVAAAWMMTSITSTPIWVALVQTASTLPMFILGLPSGALADSLDRKGFFLVTQLWLTVVARRFGTKWRVHECITHRWASVGRSVDYQLRNNLGVSTQCLFIATGGGRD